MTTFKERLGALEALETNLKEDGERLWKINRLIDQYVKLWRKKNVRHFQ